MSDALLRQAIQQSQPFFSQPQIFTSMGLGLNSGGALGAVIQSLLGPLVQSIFGGNAALGQFFPTNPYYQQLRSQQAMIQQQQLIASMAQQDIPAIVRMTTGLGNLMGARVDPAAATLHAQNFTRYLAPMIAMQAPQLYDQMFGTRGSALSMALGMFPAFQTMRDPTTGALGLSVQQQRDVSRRLFESFFGAGTDPNVVAGLSAGQVGGMVAQLQTRGLLGTEAGTAEGQFQRIRDGVRRYSRTVRAMLEILGPNSSMEEVFRGLEVLTQNSFTRISPERAERLVRDMQAISQRTNVGIDTLVQLQVGGGRIAGALGLDRVFAASAAGAAAIASSQYASSFGTAQFLHRATPQEMALRERQLTLNATASPMANQFGALLRVRDMLEAGSEGEALAEAVAAGRSTYTYQGRTRSVFVNPSEWARIMSSSGISADFAASMLNQNRYNQNFITDNVTRLVRRGQLETSVLPAARQVAASSLASAGLGRFSGLAGSIASGFFDLESDQVQNPAQLRQSIADVIERQLRNRGVAITPELRQQIEQAAENFAGALPEHHALRGHGTAVDILAAHGRRAADSRDQLRQQLARHRDTMAATAGRGMQGPGRRIADALLDAASGAVSWRSVLGRILNVNPVRDFFGFGNVAGVQDTTEAAALVASGATLAVTGSLSIPGLGQAIMNAVGRAPRGGGN